VVGFWEAETQQARLGRIHRLLTATLERIGASVCPVTAVVSRALQEYYVTELGIRRDRVVVIHESTVDDSLFAVEPPSATRGPKVIMYIGRLTPVKNLMTVVSSFGDLVGATACDIRLVFVGDGILRETLTQRVQEMGLGGLVSFQGHVPHHKLPQLLSSAWVVVLASFSEGLGKAIMEAAAAARPVVASNVGGIPEIVDDGITGTLVNPRNKDELTRALRDLLVDEDKAIRMGQAAREKMRGFTAKGVIGQWIELLKEKHWILGSESDGT